MYYYSIPAVTELEPEALSSVEIWSDYMGPLQTLKWPKSLNLGENEIL